MRDNKTPSNVSTLPLGIVKRNHCEYSLRTVLDVLAIDKSNFHINAILNIEYLYSKVGNAGIVIANDGTVTIPSLGGLILGKLTVKELYTQAGEDLSIYGEDGNVSCVIQNNGIVKAKVFQELTTGITLKCATGNQITVDDGQTIVNSGWMHLIPTASRPAFWILNGGAATNFTLVDFSAYVPSGVKGLLLAFSSTGEYWMRAYGSTTNSITQNDRILGTAGISVASKTTVECDSLGRIEYKRLSGISLYLNIVGFYF